VPAWSITPRRFLTALVSVIGLAVASIGLWAGFGGMSAKHAAGPVPTPDHVVVVIMENHAYGQVIGSPSAPYINSLKSGGANLLASYAVTHPSQPNYYALFSGSTQGVTDDNCVRPGFSSAANLGSELIAAGKAWASYNEGAPSQGSTLCTYRAGKYAQKHNPWFGFRNVPVSSAKTFTQFPSHYANLPQVSFVTPDMCHDMHDCSVSAGDNWVKSKLGGYATWAKTHNSLLVLTFDEDDELNGNRIPTVLFGQPVRAGSSSPTTYDRYSLLRTIEDMYGTSHAGNAASAPDITGIWARGR
jgi:phospholipase C